MSKLKITYKSVSELAEYKNNARKHSDKQIQQIAKSIEEFGFNNPIAIDETGTIIAGHGRLYAARLLELDVVPTVLLKGLDQAKRMAYVIADNKIAANSSWDDEMLEKELLSLSEADFDLDILGWDVLPEFTQSIDYSILDDDLDEELDGMQKAVKKAIQIEFIPDDFEKAQQLVKEARNKEVYIGAVLMDALSRMK
tara:strand:- start:4464 stop:5054 length:591 start_codon:yes stop_codon:yes gene_type:complete